MTRHQEDVVEGEGFLDHRAAQGNRALAAAVHQQS